MITLKTGTSTLKFPPRNDAVRAIWTAYYIEPMVGSGERICIGVAVANNSGFLVVPVSALSRLTCIYGEAAGAIVVAAEFVTQEVKHKIATVGYEALRSWKPSAEGIFVGRAVESTGASLEDIARSALMMSASLVEKLSEAEEDIQDPNERLSGSRLEEQIKARVVELRPGLGGMFGLKRKHGENIRAVQYGFVGNVIAANFGVLNPHRLTSNVKDIKSKLWDLGQLRDDVTKEVSLFAASIQRYELMFYRPPADAPEYSTKQMVNVDEAVNELEAEADKQDLRCRDFSGYEAIAQEILAAEAA